ncbi:probable salivary secreted peptide [Phymastichus coffea]|uniref:probable salivary secreted peptide n=1 Tax=Phymastichus coffea TaxID=108790 RepID=UPI00273B486E|nr:probable salivary secreted peptide [Phymastichus coffea]
MSSQRMLFFLVLIASVAMTLSATIKPNDLILGSRLPGDHLLQREFIKIPSKIMQVVKHKQTFIGDNYSKITQVKLLDQNKKSNGATAAIVNGGPGLSYVGVDFKSKRGHSIDFIVELYGR